MIKNKIKTLMLLMIVSFSNFAQAGLYDLYVTRVDNNLYKSTDGRVVILTQYCYEYAIGDRVILKYDRYDFDNKIIFGNTTCDVKSVYAQ